MHPSDAPLTAILGSARDEPLHSRLHALGERVETVELARSDLARRRLRVTTDRGRSVAIASRTCGRSLATNPAPMCTTSSLSSFRRLVLIMTSARTSLWDRRKASRLLQRRYHGKRRLGALVEVHRVGVQPVEAAAGLRVPHG